MATYIPNFDPNTWYQILYVPDGSVLCTYNNEPSTPGFASCGPDSSQTSQQFQIFATPNSNASNPTFLIRNHLAGPSLFCQAICTGTTFCESNTVAIMNSGNLTSIETVSEWKFEPSSVGNESSHILNVGMGSSFFLDNDDRFIHMIDDHTGNRSNANWQFLSVGAIRDVNYLITPTVSPDASVQCESLILDSIRVV